MKDKKQQIIDLWKICFNDSNEFINLFFQCIYKEENALVIRQGEEIVSALQLLPYVMNYQGLDIPISYIYGVCTKTSERNKGLMHQLLQNAFEEALRRGNSMVILIPAEPWLFELYRKNGFTEAFFYTEEEYRSSNKFKPALPMTIQNANHLPIEKLHDFFDHQMRKRTCCILHDIYDLYINTLDRNFSQEKVLIALDNKKKTVGMAFIKFHKEALEEKVLYIDELLYENIQVKDFLIQRAISIYHAEKAICRIPASPDKQSICLGMAHLIDRKALIEKWLSLHPSQENKDTLMTMEENSLLHLLFNKEQYSAYMSLMLE